MKFVTAFFAVIIIFIIAVLLLPVKEDQKNPTTNILQNKSTNQNNLEKTIIVAQDLDTPWGIEFLPGSENNFLVTERGGAVRLVQNNGSKQSTVIGSLNNVREIGEGGLLGITLHPDFSSNHYVYFYYTYGQSGGQNLNRVVRMKFENNNFGSEEIIVNEIPGAPNHNGGRIKFGPDKLLYITTGDAQNPSLAQSRNSLAGKILRTTDDGRQAPGNPFSNRVYSYGHRNPQGIAWDQSGRLWSTEHGRSGGLSGLDEINLIEVGKNYGWEIIQGDEARNGLETPEAHSASDTWAPASAAVLGNKLYFGGLRGEALYEAEINGTQIGNVKEHFKNELGRIREVIVGPDQMLYITTSNNDGRGRPNSGDDKVIRINPNML